MAPAEAPKAEAPKAQAPTQEPKAAAKPAEAKKMEVDFWVYLNPDHPQSVARQKAIEKFNAENKDGIVASFQAGAGIDKVKANAAAGQPPAVHWHAYYESVGLYAAGLTVDLNEALKAERGWAEQKADYVPTMLATSSWKGRLGGLPTNTNNNIVIWNPTLLQQAGLTDPKPGWTWDDLVNMAQKAAKPPEIWGLDWITHFTYWHGVAGTAGFTPLNPDGTKFLLDSEPAVWATTFINDLINKHKLAPRPGDIKEEQFKDGKTVFELQGPFRMPRLRNEWKLPFGVVHLPVKTKRFAPAGGQNVAVFKLKNKDQEAAAAKLAMWMGSPATQVFVILNSGGTDIPVSKSAMEHPDLKAHAAKDKEYGIFLAEVPYMGREPGLPSGYKVFSKAGERLNEIFLGKVDVKTGMDTLQKEAQVQLEEDLKFGS